MTAVEHLEQRSLRRAPNLVYLNSGASQGAVEGGCGSEDQWPLAKVLRSIGGNPPAADAEQLKPLAGASSWGSQAAPAPVKGRSCPPKEPWGTQRGKSDGPGRPRRRQPKESPGGRVQRASHLKMADLKAPFQ